MDVESIRHFCLCFPDAKENLQWGEDLCFKVRGKIFAVLDLGSVPQRLSFKCTPEKFAELTEHEGISPAPYVGRYKMGATGAIVRSPGARVERLDSRIVRDGGGKDESQDCQPRSTQTKQGKKEAIVSAQPSDQCDYLTAAHPLR